MNITSTTARTVRHSLGLAALAAPIAAAITLAAGTAAHADSQDQPILTTVVALTGGTVNPDLPPGPGELTADLSCLELDTCGLVPEDPEVVPNPDIPEGPGDLVVETPCWVTETCGGGGEGEEPELNPDIPEGPGDFEVETPCWQTDTCPPGDDEGEDGDEDGDDEAEDDGEPSVPTDTDDGDDFDKPTRIDAGSAVGDADGLQLAWLLPGGLLVSAAGAAFAARRVRTEQR